jgi:hypothetical protein
LGITPQSETIDYSTAAGCYGGSERFFLELPSRVRPKK